MEPAFNLLEQTWLPVLRRSGPATIRPAQITEALDTDPVLAIDWARADFRIATLEFLIGLLATACPPEDSDAWMAGWFHPPNPAALDAAFAPITHAFNLDGEGPRFLQDFEDLVSGAEPIERLLIEAPGGSTITKNTDLLVRRGRVASLGRAAAAMMLYTFQSWAPAGGAGNRTGLRGGGPLITLVLPSPDASLWHLLWANMPCHEKPDPQDFPRIFPWLAPTVTSEADRTVTPQQAHTLQLWWGMPRRIRLDFAPLAAPAPCDLTGVPDSVQVVSWRQRPRGANYAGWGDLHPLTPRYQVKPATEVLPVHPQPGGIGYRHWLGLVASSGDGLRRPAPSVAAWRDERVADVFGAQARRTPARLLAAGYDMDNMKARGFVETEMPLPGNGDLKTRQAMDALAKDLVLATEQVASLLRGAVRAALFSAGATVKLDAEVFSTLRERLWDQTEASFFASLEAAAAGVTTGRQDWMPLLRRIALALFDEAAPLHPHTAGSAAPRIGRARRNLLFALTGFGKDGAALFTLLQLPVAESKARKKEKAA
ncbi:type I-E CRISPR-associated protein Cse1/CasA [Roseomonas marmotae]|uniref:type I-E CRISPR-associated protein Cse1/CasA n=1 Tax=Roseomonas marmotae TaxID=2768161 RepID=UPI0038CF8DA6